MEYWQASGARGDAFVTRALGIALRLSLLDEHVLDFWSQGVSLILTGAMIFSSVRAFLVQASRVAVRIEARVAQVRLLQEKKKRLRAHSTPPQPPPQPPRSRRSRRRSHRRSLWRRTNNSTRTSRRRWRRRLRPTRRRRRRL